MFVRTTLMSLSKSEIQCKNVCRMKWRIIRLRYQRFDFNSVWWFEKLLNHQLVSKQSTTPVIYYLFMK